MLFNIAPNNAEKVWKSFTVSRPEHVHGYTASAILTPKNKRLSYSYQIDIIDNTCIVCTVRHIETDTLFAVVKLSNYTAESIEVEHGELYKNCSAYPYRREYNDKYLKKYDQIACIVHGAIAAGLLFDTAEATTTEETSEAVQDTYTDREPQEATETAQREPETVTGYIVQCRESRNQWTDYTGAYQSRAAAEKAKACAESRHTCDRYGKEIMYRIAEVQKRPEDVMNDSGHYKTGETVTYNGIIYTQYSNAPAFTPYLWESRTESGEIIVRLARTLDECKDETRARAAAYMESVSAGTVDEYHMSIAAAILSAAESREDIRPQENTTAPKTDAQRATESAKTTAGDTTTTPHQTAPPRATDAATTGEGEQTTTAAAPTPSGDRSTANKMTGRHAEPAKEMTAERSERRKRYLQRMFNELARKRRKARRDAKEMTTGRTTPPSHTCENAPQGPETIRPRQDTTGADTEPPRAQEANQEPGHAAGDHSGQASDHITGPTTGNTSGAAAEAITGRTTTPPQHHGHACENAPGRTERAQAEQVHTQHTKSPPRGTGSAADHQQRGRPNRRKGTFSWRISKTWLKIRIIKGTPIFAGDFQKN